VSYSMKTRAILTEMWVNFLEAKDVTQENICKKVSDVLQ
jgi:hypothetical protein